MFILIAIAGSVRGDAESRDPVLWQTRSCVGETAWREDECIAMTHVHLKRARLRGVAPLTMIRAYSAPVRRRVNARYLSVRPWARLVRLLEPTGAKPAAWPSNRPWRRYQGRFAELMETVQRVFDGEIPDPCPEAIHYGGPAWLDNTPTGFEEDESCLPESTSRQRFFRPRER